jgi:hypothetical protein
VAGASGEVREYGGIANIVVSLTDLLRRSCAAFL